MNNINWRAVSRQICYTSGGTRARLSLLPPLSSGEKQLITNPLSRGQKGIKGLGEAGFSAGRLYRLMLKNSNFVRRQISFQRAVDTLLPSPPPPLCACCVLSPPRRYLLPPPPSAASTAFDPAKSADVNRDSEMEV